MRLNATKRGANIPVCLRANPGSEPMNAQLLGVSPQRLPCFSFCLLLLWTGLFLIGCQVGPPLPPGPATPDFTLTLNARTLGSAGEVVQAYTFVLEPDRTLRVAIGAGCTLETYPDPTRMLSVQQVRTLYDLTRQIDFDAEPGDGPNAGSWHVISTLVVSRGQRLKAFETVPIRNKQALATEPSARLFSTLLAYGLVPEQAIAPAAPATDP